MEKCHHNKRVLVIGGSRGIGAGIVRRFAEEGADVVFTYVSNPDKANETASVAKAHGVKSIAIKADSADEMALITAVEQAAKELGGIDVLINNAGVALIAPLPEFKLEDFDRTFNINVRAVFIATQAAVKHMKSGGRVINIGSCNADRMPFAGGAVYAMSKSALQGLVKGLARDLGPLQITVNNIQPGPVDTDMNPADGAFADSLRGLMALPRYGTADEIAAITSFIASPEAGFITGASLTIDGGFSA